jgi:hypothetical protein
MTPAQRAAAGPLVAPLDIVDVVVDLVRDDTCSGTVVELSGR